uniref:NADH-ubiquinone oxidoreductase chain 5 n=1 Tax=Neolethaeus assamensis TaxID=1589711 RepID=A0A343ISH1_9HEMI|nr:NADH dehydrogenase subunit 5 [Neolethaeus assamensis]AST10196.1 NADH dehydrogenase subunit 5 [Neolethaeus assamensis]
MNLYLYWVFILSVLGVIFYSLGLYFIYYDYSLFVDFEFFSLNSCSFVMTFLYDWMSLSFMGGVFFISSMVIYYSDSYMSHDFYSLRFLLLVLLFVFSMMLMIVSPNLISILLGWDGLGLVSYCLVIYFQNSKSYNAGMLTILTNRLGDVFILICISLVFNSGSWHYLFYNFYFFDWSLLVSILVVLAAFTKSAQIPFSSWLPAAMAAPTPVSALVHSSTLVTAGVYLLIRFYPLISLFNMNYFLFFSMMTMFMSGLGANFEFDLKSIIALSTLSQLGLMMSILFMGFPFASFFHLMSHAFFKALLFLCAGLIIHGMSDSQDIRHMGMMLFHMPYTSVCFCVANFSLCGLPFLSGFYSKDLVLELLSYNHFNLFIFIMFYLSVGLTVSYSVRLMYYCLLDYNGLFSIINFFEDLKMMRCMLFLVFMGVMGGSLMYWQMCPYPPQLYLPFELKVLPLFFVSLGGYLGYEFSFFSFLSDSYSFRYNLIYWFLGSMWFMPSFSTYMIYSKGYLFSWYYVDFMDMGWGEYLVSGSFSNILIIFSRFNVFCQKNSVKFFFLSFLVVFCILIII